MKSNRRSVLIGLIALTVVGGAVFGTGAFSQVEADRDVSINTTGDGSALLALSANTGQYNGATEVDNSKEAIELNFSTLNSNATTTFDGLLTVTNNGSNNVNLTVENTGDITFYDSSGTVVDGTNSVTINAGASETLDVEIDLTGQNAVSDTQTVTFVANSTA